MIKIAKYLSVAAIVSFAVMITPCLTEAVIYEMNVVQDELFTLNDEINFGLPSGYFLADVIATEADIWNGENPSGEWTERITDEELRPEGDPIDIPDPNFGHAFITSVFRYDKLGVWDIYLTHTVLAKLIDPSNNQLPPSQELQVQGLNEWRVTVTPPIVPEPLSSTLFIVGAATLVLRRLRKRFHR